MPFPRPLPLHPKAKDTNSKEVILMTEYRQLNLRRRHSRRSSQRGPPLLRRRGFQRRQIRARSRRRSGRGGEEGEVVVHRG